MKRTTRTTAPTVGALAATRPAPDTRGPAGVTEQIPYTADN
ncbi:hypothetical protein ACFY30_07040 [Streptomyces sp. NPDC000345]